MIAYTELKGSFPILLHMRLVQLCVSCRRVLSHVRVTAHTPLSVAREAAMGSRAERLVWVDLEVRMDCTCE